MKHFFGERRERLAVELFVKGLDFSVFFTLAVVERRIALVEAGDAGFADGIGLVGHGLGLAAARDAAAGAGHHFDEMVLLAERARTQTVEEFAGRLRAVDDGDVDGEFAHLQGRLLDVLQTAHGLQVEEDGRRLFAGDEAVGRAKGGFHHAARIAEDHGGAGTFAHQTVVGAVGKGVEVDAGIAGPVGELGRGHHEVHVAHRRIAELAAGGVHFVAADFGLLGGAGGDGHVDDLLRIEPHLLGEVGLDGRTLHADRALGRRNVGEHVGMEGFAVADPGRAAAGKLRKRAAALGHAFDELAAFLKNREVGAEVRVEHVVGAERAQKRDHLAFDKIAVRTAEFLAETDAHGGTRGEDDDLVGIGDGLSHLFPFGLDLERADGADGNALTAVDADGLVARLSQIVVVVDADVVVADAGTEPALHAEGLIAHNGRIARIDRDAHILRHMLGHMFSCINQMKRRRGSESRFGRYFIY